MPKRQTIVLTRGKGRSTRRHGQGRYSSRSSGRGRYISYYSLVKNEVETKSVPLSSLVTISPDDVANLGQMTRESFMLWSPLALKQFLQLRNISREELISRYSLYKYTTIL